MILSLTRTSRVGYLRDIRRLTVALSRARLGLYILGRREVFESCFELRQAFEILFQRPDKLTLMTGEMWPSKRLLADEKKKRKALEGEFVMEGVEHLGQYVFEMTNARVQQLRAERGLPEHADSPVEPMEGMAIEDTEVYDEELEDAVDGYEVEEES